MGALSVTFMANFHRIEVVGTSSAFLPVGISVHRQLSQHTPCSAVAAKPLRIWCEITRARGKAALEKATGAVSAWSHCPAAEQSKN